MKCCPTTPFDVAPQMKNVPARIQNSQERSARRMIPGSACSGSTGVVRRRTASPLADVRRPFPEQQGRRHDRDEQQHRHRQGRLAPAERHGDDREQREEHELAGARARPEHADHQAPAADEPAVRDDRPERARDEARPEPRDEAEQQHQLPQLAGERRRAHPERRQQQRADGEPADAEAVDEDAGDWPAEAEQEQPRGTRDRDLGDGPARVGLDAEEQGAGRGARAGAQQDDRRGDDEDDPAVPEAPGVGRRRSGDRGGGRDGHGRRL